MMPEPAPAPVTRPPNFVGVDPIPRIVMMEDHDKAYFAWKEAGCCDRIAVHIDPHLDFGWVPEKDPEELLELESLQEFEKQLAGPSLWNFSGRPRVKSIQIGNYLNPALREGLLRSFYWVVPDGFLATPEQRKEVEEFLSSLEKANPRAFGGMEWIDGSLTAEIYGKPVVVCSLSDLPEFDESVLLDTDTDFFLIDTISSSYPYAHSPSTSPWIWPEELVARLHQNHLQTDFVTIAYSVEGGYTALGYKYLGDEIAGLLGISPGSGNRNPVAGLKRSAVELQQQGNLDEARKVYQDALALNSEDASIHYQLAQVCHEQDQEDETRDHFRQAVGWDPSYQTAYNNLGLVYLSLEQVPEARAEFEKALAFNPEDAHAHLGLGDLHTRQRSWKEAIFHYRRACDLKPADGEACLSLGWVHIKLHDWDAAEQWLGQALASKRPQGAAHYWLGLVYLKKRRWEEALTAYKAARRLGLRNLQVYRNLGRLYLRKGNLYQAWRNYQRVLRTLPSRMMMTGKLWLIRVPELLGKRGS